MGLFNKSDSQLTAENKALRDEIKTQKTENADLIAKVLKLEIENERLGRELALISTTEVNAAPKKPELPTTPFQYNGKKYQVTAPAVTLPVHGKVTANDILANEELQKELVELGAGCIREID